MDFFGEVFKYQFLTNAFIASLLSGIALGIVGAYIVSRRLVFLSGGITHASFGGIGIAYYMGINPIAGAMVFAVLSSMGIEYASDRWKMREDSAIGIIWSVGMAVGIIFIYLTPGYAPNLMSFLFGNILAVTSSGIMSLIVLDAVIVVLFATMYRQIMFVAFDREFARSQGVPTKIISYMMAVLIAVTIVLSIKVVGIMLLISLLTIPVAIVSTFTGSYKKISIWAALTASAGNVVGLFFSYKLNIPAGAATIFVLAVALIIVKLLPLCCKKRTAA